MVDLTVQQLRMLREVARRGTIAAAADALGYTPSAVSQQLGGIERSTGVAVLERAGRNVVVTDAGWELVRHADDIVRSMEAAQAGLEAVNGAVAGRFDISVYETVAATVLPLLLQRISTLHPDLTVFTRQLDPDHAIDALARGDIDLAFDLCYDDDPPPIRAGVEREVLFDDPFVLAVPELHPFRGAVDLADVASEPLISSATDLSCGRFVERVFRHIGVEPHVRHEIDDYATTLRLIATGQGVSLLPRLGLVNVPPGVRLVELASPLSRSHLVAHRTTSAGRPAVRAVREIVADIADELVQLAA